MRRAPRSCFRLMIIVSQRTVPCHRHRHSTRGDISIIFSIGAEREIRRPAASRRFESLSAPRPRVGKIAIYLMTIRVIILLWFDFANASSQNTFERVSSECAKSTTRVWERTRQMMREFSNVAVYVIIVNAYDYHEPRVAVWSCALPFWIISIST